MRRFFPLVMLVLAACDTETPTTTVLDNDYPPVADGGDPSKETTVYKGWWVVTLFTDPVTPASESDPIRTVPASDYAYAVLAPGWDPSMTTPPASFVVLKSHATIAASRGDTLHIRVSDATFDGNCAAGKPLSQDDADFITQRIFPAEFANVRYDAKTCTSTPLASDGGNDGDDGG